MQVFAKTGHLNTVLGGRLICDVGLYVSIYGSPYSAAELLMVHANHIFYKYYGVIQ